MNNERQEEAAALDRLRSAVGSADGWAGDMLRRAFNKRVHPDLQFGRERRRETGDQT